MNKEDVDMFFKVKDIIENGGNNLKYLYKFNNGILEYNFKVINNDIECSWIEPLW